MLPALGREAAIWMHPANSHGEILSTTLSLADYKFLIKDPRVKTMKSLTFQVQEEPFRYCYVGDFRSVPGGTRAK